MATWTRSAAAMAVVLEAACSGGGGGARPGEDAAIRVDQAGYHPALGKLAMVVGAADGDFHLEDVADPAHAVEILSGPLPAATYWDAAGEQVRVVDLSAVAAPGAYRLTVDGLPGADAVVSVDAGAFRRTAEAGLRSLALARASVAIGFPVASGLSVYDRPAGHPDDALAFDPITFPGRAGTWSAPGGWYDAGDYGKYTVNGDFAAGVLLDLLEAYPAAFGDDAGLPGSGNGASDLADELRFQLDWLAAMQDDDGGVFFKVGGNDWSPFVMPADDTTPRYVIGKSTTSTVGFAAVMAKAARLYREVDPGFAAGCLDRAERAWAWAGGHPAVGYPAQNTLGTGPYEDGPAPAFDDEHLWAATELYLATGEAAYLGRVEALRTTVAFGDGAWWQGVGNLAFLALTVAPHVPDDVRGAARAAVIAGADRILAAMARNPYHYGRAGFEWGSAGSTAAVGVTLVRAYRLTGERRYLSAAAECLAFVLGRNPVGRSFMTGVGTDPPRSPHDRRSASDGVLEPIPGQVVGGINAGMEDRSAGVEYPDTRPARCYRDVVGSWSSNEPAINQTANVIALAAALDVEANALP